MNVPGVFVNQNGVYYPTKEVYVNDQGTWKIANAIYVNNNGIWYPAAGQQDTYFTSISGYWGMVPRPSPYTYSPPPSEGTVVSRGNWINAGSSNYFGPSAGP
jgi:hypothetical protein